METLAPGTPWYIGLAMALAIGLREYQHRKARPRSTPKPQPQAIALPPCVFNPGDRDTVRDLLKSIDENTRGIREDFRTRAP